jgi:hypothetical protein
VGRVLTSTVYRNLSSLCKIIQMLVMVKALFGAYMYQATPDESLTLKTEKQPFSLEFLGRALESSAVLMLISFFAICSILEGALGLLYATLERFTLEDHEKVQRDYKKALRQLGKAPDDDRTNEALLEVLTSTKVFRYTLLTVVLCRLAISILDPLAAEEGMDCMEGPGRYEKDLAELARINPYRDILPQHDAVLRERESGPTQDMHTASS